MNLPGTLHNHCNLCDGKDTPEAMVNAAIQAGFTDWGMSCHCHDEKFPLSLRSESNYKKIIEKFKTKFSDKIKLYCGIEQDMYGMVENKESFDYVISSIHNLPLQGTKEFFCIDNDIPSIEKGLRHNYGNDGMAMVRDYFEHVAQNTLQQKPDILGHFDIIIKLNEKNRYFDEDDDDFKRTALESLNCCLETGAVVEINTGGIYRGFRNIPYPKMFVLNYLKEKNARVMINTDSHDVKSIDFGIADSIELMRSVGFKELTVYENGMFVQKDLKTFSA